MLCMYAYVCVSNMSAFVRTCLHAYVHVCVCIQCGCMDMYVSDRHNRHFCLLCMVYFKEGEGFFCGGVYACICTWMCAYVCLVFICVYMCVCVSERVCALVYSHVCVLYILVCSICLAL